MNTCHLIENWVLEEARNTMVTPNETNTTVARQRDMT